MPLPKRPERSAPVPNQPFSSPEVTSIRGPYWDMALGEGLEADGQGSVQTLGSTPSEPSAMLYGPGGFVGLGSGLEIGPNGQLQTAGEYIYCTPQFGNLPVSYPPYECDTEVNTAGVTNFNNAWNGCAEITEFPCVDTSSGIDFTAAWRYCSGLTSFPALNLSSGIDFERAWLDCLNLTSFPRLDVSQGVNFEAAWTGCSSLTSFPPAMFDSCLATNFDNAWFYCALSQNSVNNILVSLNTAGQSNGTLVLSGGTSSAPGPAGLAAKASLQARGWTVTTN